MIMNATNLQIFLFQHNGTWTTEIVINIITELY